MDKTDSKDVLRVLWILSGLVAMILVVGVIVGITYLSRVHAENVAAEKARQARIREEEVDQMVANVIMNDRIKHAQTDIEWALRSARMSGNLEEETRLQRILDESRRDNKLPPQDTPEQASIRRTRFAYKQSIEIARANGDAELEARLQREMDDMYPLPEDKWPTE